jgi:hypothetical protein
MLAIIKQTEKEEVVVEEEVQGSSHKSRFSRDINLNDPATYEL